MMVNQYHAPQEGQEDDPALERVPGYGLTSAAEIVHGVNGPR